MKILYIGFKGVHNSSYKLVNSLQGEKVFLTNSFEGLKKDIENIDEEYDIVYMFGLDKTLKESVRIEKCAEKDGELLYTNIELEDISEKFSSHGVESSISSRPTRYLCIAAYFYMLAKMEGSAVFIHIPSLKNLTDEKIYSIYPFDVLCVISV